MKVALFVLVLLAIAGAVFYISSTKVHPGQVTGPVQTIALSTPSPTPSSTPSPSPTSTTNMEDNMGVAPEAATSALAAIVAADKDAGYKPAIEIVDPTGFVNVSSSFTLGSLIGKKVILLEFWTYSCINCIHTLPYVTSWYQKYKDQGFVVVGIQTPEFAFEKDINNVIAATKQYGITYPVVLDNNYGTWNAYGNLYWPHEYLIDIAGYIVHDHIGEGDYDTTEGIIQTLLKERALVYENGS